MFEMALFCFQSLKSMAHFDIKNIAFSEQSEIAVDDTPS